ncbi:hypothetical protein [Salinithrix halophila]|uniref:Uncharacterized protein n=1 Tax=Salinithrix halophila TaxID=1485204 RepID=A0ABV8JGX7_9BACL
MIEQIWGTCRVCGKLFIRESDNSICEICHELLLKKEEAEDDWCP